MTDRQFLWGLSGGVSALALGGFFWFGVGLSASARHAGWLVFGLSTAFQFGMVVGLLWLAGRLRRRTGFSAAELRQGGASGRRETRPFRVAFVWVTLGQALLIGLGVWWFRRANRGEMIWPWIGLIASLHLVPLARVLHVRAFYVTALAGGIICIIALAAPSTLHNLAYFAGVMAAIMWLSAAYLLRNADRIAAKALNQNWSV
jgi:hypothetical protein